MSRVDELKQKYPELSSDFILRWDILNEGVRDAGDIDGVSAYMPQHHSYQTYDHDISLNEYVARRPEGRLKDGRVLRPQPFVTKSGLGAGIRLSRRSPYEVREVGDGRFAFFEGEEQVDVDIYFPPPEPWDGKEPVTSRGTPVSRLVQDSGTGNYNVFPVRFCEYFRTGDQCKFCNLNATLEDSRSTGAFRPTTEQLEDMVEAYKIRISAKPCRCLNMEMGNTLASEEETIQARFLRALLEVSPEKPPVKVFGSALPRKGLQRLKDLGVDLYTMQLEVWDPELFPEICPGKAKRMPYQGWLESTRDAVDIFGVGNVGGKIIAGLTLIPENGHKTWQEALACHIEGQRWMSRHGVFPTTSHLRLPPGSVYGENPSLRDKLPPTEYCLELALAHHADMKENRHVMEKHSPYLYSTNLASTILVGELTLLEMAADPKYRDHWITKSIQGQLERVARIAASEEGEAGDTPSRTVSC